MLFKDSIITQDLKSILFKILVINTLTPIARLMPNKAVLIISLYLLLLLLTLALNNHFTGVPKISYNLEILLISG